jgi:hypothetical protein
MSGSACGSKPSPCVLKSLRLLAAQLSGNRQVPPDVSSCEAAQLLIELSTEVRRVNGLIARVERPS